MSGGRDPPEGVKVQPDLDDGVVGEGVTLVEHLLPEQGGLVEAVGDCRNAIDVVLEDFVVSLVASVLHPLGEALVALPAGDVDLISPEVEVVIDEEFSRIAEHAP